MYPEPVSVQPVVARVSIRALDQSASSAFDFDDLEPEIVDDDESIAPSSGGRFRYAVPWVDLFPPRAELTKRLPSAAAEGVLGAAAIWMISQDERLAVAGGVVVGVAAIVRTLGRRITFSFGAGFVGYRAEMDWPQGVQEDDDVRWRWRPAESGHASQPS
jgi:hypothetical protein